jgi:hypothetical protein
LAASWRDLRLLFHCVPTNEKRSKRLNACAANYFPMALNSASTAAFITPQSSKK